MKNDYRITLRVTSFTYVVQAIVNCLPPLLFVTFQNEFSVSLGQISLLITFNFVTQLFTDLTAALFVPKIGYRASMLLALGTTVLGFFSYALLPALLPSAFVALAVSSVICAMGGGLLEVVGSPIVEALPGDAKTSTMSFIHSFYCLGQGGVALLATLYFVLFGIHSWRGIFYIFSSIPALLFVFFCFVPICEMPSDKSVASMHGLFSRAEFLLLFFMMFCAGATELGVSQWASLFCEQTLGVSKATGDLLGVCLFALSMGAGRVFFGIYGEKISLSHFICGSFVLAVLSYLLIVFSPTSALSLVGFGLAGLSSALLWPGIYVLGGKHVPLGGAFMFALFAFAGDVGCTLGPDLIGFASESEAIGSGLSSLFSNFAQAGLRSGVLLAVLFPLCGAILSFLFIKRIKK